MNEVFYKTYFQIFEGIELCLENKLQLPALSLIYSCIDSLAWIAYGDIPVKERFVKWIDEYMYKEKKLEPTSLDLYSARCAIVHTLTPNSNISQKKKAKIVAYAWGNADSCTGNKTADIMGDKQIVFVHIRDLFESLKFSTLRFIDGEIDNDCADRISKHFRYMPQSLLEDYCNLSECDDN